MIKNIANSLFSGNKLTKKMANSYISAKKKAEDDIILIRHAQSQFNTACEQYRQAHNIPYVWKQLCNHEGFDQKVLFNVKYIDCSITQKGRQQCKKQREKLKDEDIDCILVSPQIRALQTCEQLFKGKKIPVIVQPMLVGPFRSCSDISKPNQQKKSAFPNFNFKKTNNLHQFWYLDYLPPDQKSLCLKRFFQQNLSSPSSKRSQLLQLLRQGLISQSPIQYNKRILSLKSLLSSYKSVYKKIAIVSHYYTIQYLSALEYQACGTPKFYLDVENCMPYYCASKEILAGCEKEGQIGLGKAIQIGMGMGVGKLERRSQFA